MNFLNPSDVAARLSVSVSYVYHNWKVLEIPFVRIGGKLRIRPEAFEEWLDGLPAAV